MTLAVISIPQASPDLSSRAREDRGELCPQAAEYLRAMAERDGRVSERCDPGATASERAVLDLVRAAVFMAGEAGVSKRKIAAALGISDRTLDHWLSPAEETRGPSAAALASLLLDRRVLPAAARERLLTWTAECSGLAVVRVAAVADASDVGVQVLEVQAAGGAVCAAAAVVTDAGSAKGQDVTREEAAAMLPAARKQLRELAELVETLARIAAR